MFKEIVAIGIVMVMLLSVNSARSEDCGIVNPSFEDDDAISNLATQDPNGWTVDLVDGKFHGFVYTYWATDGAYNLSLYLNKRVQYSAGDTAKVSQAAPLDLSGVGQLQFDLKLDTMDEDTAWDPAVCTAVLMIDDDVVWESNSVGSDVRGEYYDQVYIVEDEYKDEKLHTVSFGIRMNIDAFYWDQWLYQTHWDMFECSLYCGGADPIPGDINDDCCVNYLDVELLAYMWLGDGVEPDDKANLRDDDDEPASDTIVDFYDFAVYALDWDSSSMSEMLGLAEHWLQDVEEDSEFNLFGRPSGVINFLDMTVIGNHWLECSIGDSNSVE